jgi:hypothetical protein
MGESKEYNITCDHKKSTYETEIWTTQISTGKKVTLHVENQWWWGTFIIYLTDKQKEEILIKTQIILNDYVGMSVDEGGWVSDVDEEIQDKNSYTEAELDEINKLIYCSQRESVENDSDDDTDDDYGFDSDILYRNNWAHDDTIYSFESGCVLVLVE